MKKHQIFLLCFILFSTFLLVFSPHFNNPYPIHIDEWRHINAAKSLQFNEISLDPISNSEFGFHLFLLILSKFTNLVKIFKFLPALWATLSALTLFLLSYKLTNKNFLISALTTIFFASIKSNVNILGLWFFTPLTFSIPFIFLFFYFFTQGINLKNKNYILISLIIIIALIPFHAISVLFAIPILILSAIPHKNYLKKEFKLFSLFLLIPIIGIIFLSLASNISISQSISIILKNIIFKKGWSPLEINNSFFEIYSLAGFILAFIGMYSLIIIKKIKYVPYIVWPIYLLLIIFIFRLSSISFLSPYQRNFYYFALSLPFLSAIGTYFIINKIIKTSAKSYIKKLISLIIIILTIFLTFKSYYQIPEQLELYTIITPQDYQDLIYLKQFSDSKVLANPFISTAIFSISNHYPISTIYFQNLNKRQEVELFFQTSDCNLKKQIILNNNVRFILSKNIINCPININLIKEGNNFIYENQNIT